MKQPQRINMGVSSTPPYPEEDDSPIPNFSRLMAVDPGGTNIATVVETIRNLSTPNEEPRVRVYKLTRNQWRSDCGAEKRLKTASNWTSHLRATGGEDGEQPIGAFAALSAKDVVGKTANLQQYVNHMITTAQLRPIIFEETLKPRWARAAFKSWQVKRKVLTRFWSSVRAGKLIDGTASVQPMIAYGDAVFSASGPGRVSSPTTTMYETCVAVMGRKSVRRVDEFNTTKNHHACGCELRSIASVEEAQMPTSVEDGEEEDGGGGGGASYTYKKPVRGLKLCETCHEFVDRDINAALNMLLVFRAADKGEAPPEHLRRPTPGAARTKKKAAKIPPFLLLRPSGTRVMEMEIQQILRGGCGDGFLNYMKRQMQHTDKMNWQLPPFPHGAMGGEEEEEGDAAVW